MSNPPAQNAETLPKFQWAFESSYFVSPMRLRLQDDLFAEFREHVESECRRPDRKSYDSHLAGQIWNGEQIATTDALPAKFKKIFCELGRFYVLRLAEANRCSANPAMRVAFLDSWIVKSREGDYNPAHSHGGQISGIVYVDVPPQVAEPGKTDGKLDFLFGSSNEPNLEFMGPRSVTPRVGDVYLFPAWLTHSVYPFRGPGERISVSFNLQVNNVPRGS